MADRKHTSGKWIVDTVGRDVNVYSDDSTGSIIAKFGEFEYARRHPDEIIANAKLAAASPFMLEALENVIDSFGDNEHLKEWIAREENREGSSMGFFLTAQVIEKILTVIADAQSI